MTIRQTRSVNPRKEEKGKAVLCPSQCVCRTCSWATTCGRATAPSCFTKKGER
jgi:hypothetical protein